MTIKFYVGVFVFILNSIDVFSSPPSNEEQDVSEMEKWQTNFMSYKRIADLADKSYKKEQYKKALFYYSRALKNKSPKRWYYYKQRGYCNAKLGYARQAKSDLREAFYAAQKNGDKEQLPDHRVLYCEIESRYISNDDIIQLAQDLCREKKYEEAMRCFDRAINIDKNEKHSSPNYEARGLCYYKMKNLPKAIEDYETALRNPHQSWSLKMNYTNTLLDLGRYREAIAASSGMDEYDRKRIADKLYALGKFEEALLAYTEMIVENPEGIYYKSRGNCYTRLGNLKEALKDFEKAVVKERNNRSSDMCKPNDCGQTLLCLALLDAGRIKEAVTEMEDLNACQLTSMGDTMLDQDKSGDALLCYSEAIRLHPKNADCYKKRASYYRAQEDLKNAKSDLERVVEMEPSCETCLIDLGEVQIGLGEYENARTIFGGLNTDGLYSYRIKDALLELEKAEEEERLESLKNPK